MMLLLWMSGALASFCVLAIGARELSGELSIAQSLCIRSAIGLLLLFIIYLIRSRYFQKEQITSLTKRHKFKIIKIHLFRNVSHFIAQYGWFFGIGLLPLAEVFALEFTVPIWTMIIAAFFLNEKVTKNKLLAIFLGTLGVLAIVKPGYALINYASIVVLGSAVCFAISHTTTKTLSKTESPITILLYMCIIQLPIGLLLSISTWVWPQGEQWLWLIVIGVSALSAHYCLAKAMLYADITTIITLDFFRLPLIGMVGIAFYSEKLEITLLLGGGLMLIGNLISVRGLMKSRNEN
jgi:drug/metabolite transporter (DMT)-like permease